MYYQMAQSSYFTDYEKVRMQVKESDLLFTDGKYRIAGVRFLKDVKYFVQVSYIGMRWEIPFAKQIALENGKRIITSPEYSLILFRDYMVGEKVFLSYEYLCKIKKINNKPSTFIQNILKSDVIITDKKFCYVGLKYDKSMNAPKILFMSNDTKTVNSTIQEYNIREIINKPLARELFMEHNPGDEILKLYYKSVAKIYANL